MSSQRLERNPTSSRRKAIILEVGTLGHILLTSSLFRIIVGAERGFWPAFGPTFRKRTIKRGPKGSSRIYELLFLLEVNGGSSKIPSDGTRISSFTDSSSNRPLGKETADYWWKSR
jgi:hypothetical protein